MRTRILRTVIGTGLVIVAVAGTACRRTPGSPEAEVRAVVADAEQAARDKDLGRLKDLISDRYSDDEGRTKDALKAILLRYFFQNQSIHLLTRVPSVVVAGTRATVVAFVAMAGTAIPEASILPSIRADLYRFEITLAIEDGHVWRVTEAAWQPAMVENFTE